MQQRSLARHKLVMLWFMVGVLTPEQLGGEPLTCLSILMSCLPADLLYSGHDRVSLGKTENVLQVVLSHSSVSVAMPV